MKVAVTGSSGKLGQAAVAALKAGGHRVTCLDLKPAPGGTRTTIMDCTDFGQVMNALSGIDTVGGIPDAVVHLAGIPMPGLATDQRTFEVNMLSTYNIFTAAVRLGVRRIVWASSETILGLPFTVPPAFVPVDESHPDRPEWSYALSKQLGETMAGALARWHPDLTILSLRFSNVFDAADYAQIPAIQAKPEWRRMNLWSYVDADDAGDACRLAVDAPLTDHHRMIIAAADTLIDRPTAELADTWLPGVERRTPLDGCTSLLSSDAARRLIGYEPKRSWRAR